MQWVVGIVTGVVVAGIADEEVVDDEAQVEVAGVALLQQTVAESGVLVLLALGEEVFVSCFLDGRRHLAVANRPEEGGKQVVF